MNRRHGLISTSHQLRLAALIMSPSMASNHCEQDPSTTQGCKLQSWVMLTEYCSVMWCTLAWKALFACTQTSEKGAVVTQGVSCLFFPSPLWWPLCLIRIWPTQSDPFKYGERGHECILLRSCEGSQHVSQQERDWRSVHAVHVLQFRSTLGCLHNVPWWEHLMGLTEEHSTAPLI